MSFPGLSPNAFCLFIKVKWSDSLGVVQGARSDNAEEEAGLGAPNLHPSGFVNSEVTDSRECTGLEKNLKKNPKKPFLISGETPVKKATLAVCDHCFSSLRE